MSATEMQPLLSGQAQVPVEEPYHYVFVFPNFFTEKEELIQALSNKVTLAFCKKTYSAIFKIIENPDNDGTYEKSGFNSVNWIHNSWVAFEKDSNGVDTEWIKFLRLVAHVLIKIFQDELMLEVKMFFSRDMDEIFVKIKASEYNLRVQADLMDFQVQVSVIRPEHPEAVSAHPDEIFKKEDFAFVSPYSEFQHSNTVDKNIHHTYKCYTKNGKKAKNADEVHSAFQFRDKIRIVFGIVTSAVDLGVLIDHKIISQGYCLHEEQILDGLEKDWGSFSAFHKMQPLMRIRRYFGEKISMYFAWLQYYVFWLIVPAVTGLGVFIVHVIYGSNVNAPSYEASALVFSLVLAMSSTFLDQIWVRRQNELAWIWGTTDMIEVEQQRASFKGAYQRDPVTGRKRKVPTKRNFIRAKRSVGFSITSIFVVCVLAMIIGIFIAKKKYYDYTIWFSMINAIQIKIMNIVYRIVARKLNDWENYEYDSEYNDAFTMKLYIFQFINSYISLFYIAFLKDPVDCMPEYRVSPLPSDLNINDASCLPELGSQLFSILVINTFLNVVELGMPYIRNKLAIRSERKEIEKQNAEGKHLRLDLSPEEAQAKLPDYETPLDDYMELIINYGYVVMFSIAYPLFPVVSFLLSILEVRVDAFKICVLSKRPFPAPANSIGKWQIIMQMISIIGVLTNIGILIFTAKVVPKIPFIENQDASGWMAFIVIEHILLVFKFILAELMPDMSTKVKNGLVWSKRVGAERVYGKAIDLETQRKIRNLYFVKPENFKEFVFDPKNIRNDNY